MIDRLIRYVVQGLSGIRRSLLFFLVGLSVVLIVFLLLMGRVSAQDYFDHVRAYRSYDLSIPTNAWTTLVYDAVVVDASRGSYNTTTGYFTAVSSSWYSVCAQARFAGSVSVADTTRFILQAVTYGYYTNTVLDRRTGLNDGGGTINVSVGGCSTVWLSATDTLHIEIYQNTGSSLAVEGNSEVAWLTIDELFAVLPASPTPYTPVPTDTPTSTPIPTATPTATLTPTATPDPLVITNTLSSGNLWELRREVSYGNASVALVLIVLAGLDILMLVSKVVWR